MVECLLDLFVSMFREQRTVMLLILCLCILQNVASLRYRDTNTKHYLTPNKNDNAADEFKFDEHKNSFPNFYSDVMESRRIFKWIKEMLNRNHTENDPSKPLSYEEVLNERIRFREIEKNLTVTLKKLSEVLNQILNIVKYSRYQNFEAINHFLPKKSNLQENRFKRDTNDNIVTSTEKSENNKDLKTETASNKSINFNETADKNGRRAYTPTKPFANDVVKNRLFKYIDDAFAEIDKKIDSLRQTKQMYSQDVKFRIGYIISNIDTLDVNMKNLKRDMINNKLKWDDKKILNLYDTVIVSNRATTDLLDVLKIYIDESLN